MRLNPAAGWDSRKHTWIYQTDSISGRKPRQTGREGIIVYPSISPRCREELTLEVCLSGSTKWIVGVKQSIGDPDGPTVLNMLLLSVKAPGQTHHSSSTSLMRAELIKAGSKSLNEPSASLVRVILSQQGGTAALQRGTGQLSTT